MATHFNFYGISLLISSASYNESLIDSMKKSSRLETESEPDDSLAYQSKYRGR